MQLVGRHNYPMNAGTNPFRGGATGASNGIAYVPTASAGMANAGGITAYPEMAGGYTGVLKGGSYESAVTIASITDGTSNTAAFSEFVRGDGSNNPATAKAGLGLIYQLAHYAANLYAGPAQQRLPDVHGVRSDTSERQFLHLEGRLVDRRPVPLHPHLDAQPEVVLLQRSRRTALDRDHERDHLGFAAPGRLQRCVLRRVGPVHQELGQSPGVAGDRDEEWG